MAHQQRRAPNNGAGNHPAGGSVPNNPTPAHQNHQPARSDQMYPAPLNYSPYLPASGVAHNFNAPYTPAVTGAGLPSSPMPYHPVLPQSMHNSQGHPQLNPAGSPMSPSYLQYGQQYPAQPPLPTFAAPPRAQVYGQGWLPQAASAQPHGQLQPAPHAPSNYGHPYQSTSSMPTASYQAPAGTINPQQMHYGPVMNTNQLASSGLEEGNSGQGGSRPSFGSQAYFQAIMSPGPADNTTVGPTTQDWQCPKCTRHMGNQGALATHLKSCNGRLYGPRSEPQTTTRLDCGSPGPADNTTVGPMIQDGQCPRCLRHMGNDGAVATHLKSCDISADVPRPERQPASLDCHKCGRTFKNHGGAASHRSRCNASPQLPR